MFYLITLSSAHLKPDKDLSSSFFVLKNRVKRAALLGRFIHTVTFLFLFLVLFCFVFKGKSKSITDRYISTKSVELRLSFKTKINSIH